MNIAQQRLHTQRLISDPYTTPEEVVTWFGAVQAQEYLPSLWAVGLRLPGTATEETIKQAVLDKKIVRTWPMRGTIHYVPAEDAMWMTRLLARRMNKKFTTYKDKIGLTDAILQEASIALEAMLQGGKQLTRKEIYAELENSGVPAGNGFGMHTLTHWAQEGLVVFGPHRDKQPTFVLAKEWIPHSRELEGDAALRELAIRYFRSHGPATVQDFAWWTGLSAVEARRAAELVKDDFIVVTQAGKDYLVLASQLGVPDGPSALLLPCFDEYTVAYKDRSAAVEDERLREVGYAVNNNNVIVDGRIVGSWKRTIKKSDVHIVATLIKPVTQQQKEALGQAAQRYGAFIGVATRLEFR